MDRNQRIEQFMKMAREDPENELGHFSLGKALLEADRAEDAIEPLKRAIKLRPAMSKAYQLLGDAYFKLDRREEAIEIVTEGSNVADRQGDVMPRDTMASLLREWGAPVPAFKASTKPVEVAATNAQSAGSFRCARCGRPEGQLAKAPFKGELGAKILAHICLNCWREWIGMGTKVINELGLVLSSPTGQQAYDQYMIEFLQLEEV